MKEVKKSLCAVLAALLLLGLLAGCGSPSGESPAEESTPEVDSAEATPVPTAGEPTEEEPEDVTPAPGGEESSGADGAEAAPVPADGESTEEEPEDSSTAPGGEESSGTGDDGSSTVAAYTDDNTFTSDMFGMSYTIGEDWQFIEGGQFDELMEDYGLLSGAFNSNGDNILIGMYTTDEYYVLGVEVVADNYGQYVYNRSDFLSSNGFSEDTKVSSEQFTISGEDYDGLMYEIPSSDGSIRYSISLYRVYYDYDMDATNVMHIYLTSSSKDNLYPMLDMLTFQPEEY